MTLNPRLLPHRIPSSTSTRSYKSTLSKNASLPPLSTRALFEVDSRKYESVMQCLLYPISEDRAQSRSPPQQLVRDVKSLLLKSRSSKRGRAKVADAVQALIQNAGLYKTHKALHALPRKGACVFPPQAKGKREPC